jgi:hypothetical protein
VPQIAGAIDLLPTIANLAGVKRVGDKALDGRDLSPLLLKEATEWPDRRIFSTWASNISVRTQTHRLDNTGQLFDMVADPGQTTPVNDREPGLAAELSAAVEAWRKEMYGPDATAPSKVKGKGGKAKGNPNAVDPRPLPVGYREFPVTLLPARDGEPRGMVQRSSKAPNCSYFVNWTSLEESLVWNLEVVTTGRYEVAIDYTCPLPDAGATVELRFGESRLTGKVAPGWDPPLLTNQDTLPRPDGESTMKDFKTLVLGEIDLTAGKGPLTLRAVEIPGKSVMDLRRITLTLK